MTSGNKPGPGAPPAESAPNLAAVDSAWDDDELDDDATTVAKIPQELMALSRRGAAEAERAKPKPSTSITARPPPPPAEDSVVVSVPHEQLPALEVPVDEVEEVKADDADGEEPDADLLDAGWDVEEEKAAAADVAAGLDAEARRRAAEVRAAARKDKIRSRKIAAREKRKARADSVKQKQKQKKKRSMPPPRSSDAGKGKQKAKGKAADSPPRTDAGGDEERDRPTIPPAMSKGAKPKGTELTRRRDLVRMSILVAIVVAIGAMAIAFTRH